MAKEIGFIAYDADALIGIVLWLWIKAYIFKGINKKNVCIIWLDF